MDLKQIEYFVRVAELGSFSRAAQVLGVAQPALSRHVRQLEVQLRQTLLTRNGRGATPTEAGQVLLKHGRGILYQLERAQEELGRVRGALAGQVALGLPPSLARILAVPLTHAFRSKLPNARLSIAEGLSGAMREGIVTGRLDIAVLYGPQPTQEIETAPLLEETLFVVEAASAKKEKAKPKPIALSDLARVPLLIPSRPNAVRAHVETVLSTIGERPTVALEIDGVGAILDLVATGEGAAILSRNAVMSSHHPEAYSLRAIDPPMRIQLILAHSAKRPVTLTQSEALKLVKSEVVKRLQPQ